ncbi:MAG: DUF4382 domain-containing protein [Longimicrobiales bacterium]
MRRLAMLAVAASTFAVACDDTGFNGDDDARVTILLTDAPGDVSAAVVTISSIYLQGGSSEDEAAGESGRIYLRTEPITTDLLTLSNDVATLVDNAVIAAGSYGQIRFVIDGAYLEVETDAGVKVYSTPGYEEAPETVDGELKCPSCGQSGIKVHFQGALELEGDDETLLVDFDVAETFGKEAGNSGKWVMSPSLKATSVAAAASLEASLGLSAGLSLPVVGGVAVTLGSFSAELRSVDAQAGTSGEVVSFADADGDGTFTASFGAVVPGSYTLELRGPDGLTFAAQPASPITIEVDSSEEVETAILLTAASAAS